jgi:hypothetical protein
LVRRADFVPGAPSAQIFNVGRLQGAVEKSPQSERSRAFLKLLFTFLQHHCGWSGGWPEQSPNAFRGFSMRFPLAVSAAAVVAIAIAACSGGQQPVYTAPPTGSTVASPGALALAGTGQAQSVGTASGTTGTLTYVGGTGTVTASSSATAPAGTTTVSPVDRIRVEATTSPTSPNVYYVTISSTAGATLNGLPQVSLTLSTAAVGTFQEAQFSGGTWTNVAGATAVPNSAGTAVTFPPTTKPVTLAAGGSIFLAFYQGTYPQATPAGQLANNVLADPGFENTAAALGSTVTSTGWTICTITAAVNGAAPLASRPFSSFTPTPGTTPGAAIEANGTSVPQGTGTPHPTQTTVPVHSGNSAAVFGGVFSTYAMADYAYNGLCQKVTVPNNPAASLYVWANGTENSLAYLGFDVDVLDTTGKYMANLLDENQIALTPPGDSAWRQITIPTSSLSAYSGQTVEIFVGIWTKAGSSSNSTTYSGLYFVDDFNLTGS